MLAPYSTTVLQPNEKLLAKQISHRTTLTIREKKAFIPFLRRVRNKGGIQVLPGEFKCTYTAPRNRDLCKKRVHLEKMIKIMRTLKFLRKKSDISYRKQAGI